MFGTRTSLSVIIVIGLLCVVNALRKCEYDFDAYATPTDIITFCIDNIDYVNKEESGSFSFDLDKVNDAKETVKRLKDLRALKKNVRLTNSNVTTLSIDMLFPEMTRLDLSKNSMRTINLNILPYSKHLKILNVSHNLIEEFEIDTSFYASTKALFVLDLSYNKLDRIPLNSFYSTRESLEYLDLSHNQIMTFDFYAFSNLIALLELKLSHNKIVNLGFFLYPITNLQTLYLDNNLIKEINAETFDQSKSLTQLDLSFNEIEQINDQSFKSLTKLKNLNLKSNNLPSIKEIMFKNNININKLELSFNNISFIEPGTFSLMENLYYIGLESALLMEIQDHIFGGGNVKHLNFAGSKINKIGKRPFISLRNSLQYLNLSSCEIQEISETAMDTLTYLKELDLSNNRLERVSFKTIDLQSLSKLYLRNNLIKALEPNTFESLYSLKELDLSNNEIQFISAMTFKNLKNLDKFSIANNVLDSTLISNNFFGLENIEKLDMINTKVQKWDSYVFSGMKSLKVLNASCGQLTYIDYYAFIETGNIEVLDLSYNQIQIFNVKLLSNKRLREIYLNNNKITSFSKNVFDELELLTILNLSNNNLLSVEPSAFSSLKMLKYLYLSYNPELKLSGNVFDGLVDLDTISLKKVSNQISFESASTLTVRYLDLSSSQISNVSSLHLNNIKSIAKLDLSNNNITFLDQFSFGDFTKLSSFAWLNLSHNNLEVLNPGTFLTTQSMLYLDLSHNSLNKIQFGALAGLKLLLTLDLSNNNLSTFKMSLLHDVPSLSEIFLDNNKIFSLGLLDKKHNLNKLSIGGNDISCEDVIDLKSHYDGVQAVVTVEIFNYFTENVDGIPCNSFALEDVGTPSNLKTSY